MFEHLREPPAPYAGIRSIIETPILDERKWAKIPTIPADAFLIDLEDAVPAPGKERARELAVEYVMEPSHFEGRVTIARPNHPSTPWGREDIEAFAEAEEIIATYETAIEAGNPAVTLASGKVLLVHDYEKALRLRSRVAPTDSAS